jgi:hypothetical protein
MSYCGCSSKRKEHSLDDQIQSFFGGRVVMPSEYYGVNSNRYSGEGSCGCNSELPMIKGGKRKSKSKKKSQKKKTRKYYKK